MEKCFVAVSGGVDSATALMLLKEKGYEVEGVTMIPFGRDLVPESSFCEADDARRLCESLSVRHHTVDLSSEFYKSVVGDFINAYALGETPNPCVVCNRFIKFGALAEYAFSNGADYYATGHYVRIKEYGGRRVIARAADEDKDQSYMLWRLNREQIARFIAPLGEYTKKEVRSLALDYGIPAASKSDSQDICFIPNGDYRAFLDRVVGNTDRAGDFVHKDGSKLGRHLGQRCYTIGQRKGLGIAYKEPLYVIGRDMVKNTVILGSNSDLFTKSFTVRDACFSAIDHPKEPFCCQVRIRYRAPFVPARLTPLSNGRLLVETDETVRAVTPGQSAVFYDGDILLGGGVIEA